MKRLSYANVVATLALFIALGGGAVYAAGKIGSSGIKRNAVKTKHIARGGVTTPDLANNAATGAKVAENTLSQVPAAKQVGGVTMTPVVAEMEQSAGPVTLLQIAQASVKLTCGAGFAQLNTHVTDNNDPVVNVIYTYDTNESAAVLTTGPGDFNIGVPSQVANITFRESSGKVTRLTVDAYYAVNEVGADDCYAQGTIETFG